EPHAVRGGTGGVPEDVVLAVTVEVPDDRGVHAVDGQGRGGEGPVVAAPVDAVLARAGAVVEDVGLAVAVEVAGDADGRLLDGRDRDGGVDEVDRHPHLTPAVDDHADADVVPGGVEDVRAVRGGLHEGVVQPVHVPAPADVLGQAQPHRTEVLVRVGA